MSAEQDKKRENDSQPEDIPEAKRQKVAEAPTDVHLVLLDIEGTTTPISFVADVLFPYVRKCLETHLNSHWDQEELMADIEALRVLAESDASGGETVHIIPPPTASKDEIIAAVMANVFQQMDNDRKSTALKALQGHIWQAGYSNGELKGEVWEDVLSALKKWQDAKVPVYIYSSGSVQAQKLIFGFSNRGDLLPYLSGHFDTTVGLKIESPSYKNIIAEVSKTHPSVQPSSILFVTDNIAEAIAAKEVGINSTLAIRPGNKELPADHKFSTADNFDKLFDLYRFSAPSAVAAL